MASILVERIAPTGEQEFQRRIDPGRAISALRSPFPGEKPLDRNDDGSWDEIADTAMMTGALGETVQLLIQFRPENKAADLYISDRKTTVHDPNGRMLGKNLVRPLKAIGEPQDGLPRSYTYTFEGITGWEGMKYTFEPDEMSKGAVIEKGVFDATEMQAAAD